jgi:hypothetical protein
MPRLARFTNTEIAMYFADHPPPHFDILGRDGSAMVSLAGLEIIASSGRIDVREALAWAELNSGVLWEQWNVLSGPS